MAQEIPLHDAPEHFFDQDEWREFVGHFDSRAVALRQISKPAAEGLKWIRSEVLSAPHTSDAMKDAAREEQRIADLGDALAKDFIARHVTGEFTATGVWHGSLAPVTPPKERCDGLWANFAADRFDGKDLVLTQVRVSKVQTKATIAAELLRSVTDWLIHYPDGRNVQKNVLEFQARQQFPSLKIRQFDAAYTSAYNKTRGRQPNDAPR